MLIALVLLGGAVVLFHLVLAVACVVASRRGWWRASRMLGRVAPYMFVGDPGRIFAFDGDAFGLREAARMEDAVALATAALRDEDAHFHIRNSAMDILISAGAYNAALSGEPVVSEPANKSEALNLALIQINLAEAEYNLGRWDEAEDRLRSLDSSCEKFPITHAGLAVQRAWIAAHRGRADEALALCDAVNPLWFPLPYRAEYHFARAAALLAAGRPDDADAAVTDGERVARRLSSERNALFLRARVAAARRAWVEVERLCRAAAEHPYRGQGGSGLLLWATALRNLGRDAEADDALRLVTSRDPESESAAFAAALL